MLKTEELKMAYSLCFKRFLILSHMISLMNKLGQEYYKMNTRPIRKITILTCNSMLSWEIILCLSPDQNDSTDSLMV